MSTMVERAEIPERIMEQARDVAFDFDCDWTADGRRRGDQEERDAITAIAKALLAAEKRGKEEERERCARIADAHSECERDCGDVIAAAIRGS